jgi:hypothetical protein
VNGYGHSSGKHQRWPRAASLLKKNARAPNRQCDRPLIRALGDFAAVIGDKGQYATNEWYWDYLATPR